MIPLVIPIRREREHHTEYLGKYGDNMQYMGFTFFLEPRQQRLASVLHRFDSQGIHIQSDIWEEGTREAQERILVQAIKGLPGAKAGNIAVQPFSVELNGVRFGLVPDEENEYVKYVPYGLAFSSPWDGTYDTLGHSIVNDTSGAEQKVVMSAVMGSALCGFVMQPFHTGLHKVFEEFLTGNYFKSIKGVHIVLLAAGDCTDFEGEGPGRTRRCRDGYIEVKVVIPVARWQDVETAQIAEFVATQMDAAFECLVKNARTRKELLDEKLLRENFSSAMDAFRKRVWD